MRIVPTAAALAVLVVAGCSSPPPPAGRAGSLLLGTAQVTVNDSDAGLTDQVACSVAGPLTTITTGTGDSGVTALLSIEGERPTAQSVTIRNLGGFTGSFNAGLGGRADVTTTGRSYEITGTADGFVVSQPSIRTSGDFTINVAC